MSATINITGQRFGRLVALRQQGRDSKGNAIWFCQCDCGKTILTRSDGLRSGHTQSCGCSRNKPRHGHRMKGSTRTYNTWDAMLSRCKNPRFKYYYGLGVTVCERWLTFENFLADMGERPAGTTLDRYPDPSGNYEPGNCRWATPKQQRNNQRPRIKPRLHRDAIGRFVGGDQTEQSTPTQET